MPTAETQPKEVKKENFANIREALEGAGTRVLSRLDDAIDREVRPTLEDVNKYLEENKSTVIAYAGPYTDPEDERNSWTYVQEVPPPVIP